MIADQGASKGGQLRKRLEEGILVMPGAFNAASALLIEHCGFGGVYISGAGLSNAMGYPDIGLLTLTEAVQQSRRIAEAVGVPAIADADTGFGEGPQIVRTVREFEQAGVAGIHIEDQAFPKRCGHLPGKKVVSPDTMCERIRSAVSARVDPDFLIIARTDARSVEGFDRAIRRAQAYIEAGADMVFPEALETEIEFETFVRSVSKPLLANMTEFGKSPYLDVDTLNDMGYKIVIFPLTAFRIMMKAAEEGLTALKREGTQKGILEKMQTREALYQLLGYTVQEDDNG